MANLDLNLNLLATLDVLLTEESVNRTAARFGISQAAVSAQLAKIRAHFGDEIFVPRGRKLVKTPFAETLCDPVRDVVERARHVIGLRQNFDPLQSDRVFRIHSGDIDSILLLAPLMQHLREAAPHTKLNILGSAADPAKVDFFIRPIGLHDPKLPSAVLYTDHYCVLADANHPSLGPHWNLQRYLALEHVVRYIGHSGAPSFEARQMAELGHERKQGVMVESYASIAPMLVGTEYLTTLANRFAREMSKLYPLQILPLPFDFPAQTMVLQWHEHLRHDTAAMWMRNFIQNFAEQLYAAPTSAPHTPH
ncbi:LysR family transcriptional regulator [Pseudomonas sp. S31]|uniref:LysR family transcriptional regulator n=1 Tax=Pseudomonas sp. S31 TaxID=1564473 RepID=UPI001914221E|nr:LysR family transcriptional regulator [Pseudomonas sp. S31]MBK4999736.1 LysR family transcriptional regulator [Pseudomonas sp. S31]